MSRGLLPSPPSRASVRAYYKSLNRLLVDMGVRMTATHLGPKAQTANGDDWEHDEWRVTFKKSGEQGSITFPFLMGIGNEGRAPVAEEVLEVLLSGEGIDEKSFTEWCGDLGYDTDSRKAEQVYIAEREQNRRMTGYFGATLLKNMQTALRKDNDA